MKRWLAGLWVFVAAMVAAVAGTREAYVWQRQFDGGVMDAIKSFAPQLDAVCCLAVEVSWVRGRIEIVRVPLNFPGLARVGKPIGLAVRIGDFGGNHAADEDTSRALAAVARETLAKARAAGLRVAELQIDYDCAERKLAGYRHWLEAFRAVTNETRTRLVVTALPAWLKHADFARLARVADGFVLQVHSLSRPTSPHAEFMLCDPVRTRAWVKEAGAVEIPFRVALPTYGYELGFDAQGKFLGLAAEGQPPNWPRDTERRVVIADAVAMSALARELDEVPPALCTGVIWFRLPVPRDRHNWAATTFATVLRGEIPTVRIDPVVEWTEPGLAEIVVVNRGQTTERLPEVLRVKWAEDVRPLAADVVGGFRLEIRGGEAQGIVRAVEAMADATLAPGQKARIAWLRFAHEILLEVRVAATP